MADFTLTDANPASGVNPALDVVLFGKIYDVASRARCRRRQRGARRRGFGS